MADFDKLIPELKAWNDGAGIEPTSWLSNAGNFELAIGYSIRFWPRFVEHRGYVLREGFSEDSLSSFESSRQHTKAAIESVLNHIHVADIHEHDDPTETQLRYLGNILVDIHRVKLAHDFPNRGFVVEFNDQPGLPSNDYQFSFWQS